MSVRGTAVVPGGSGASASARQALRDEPMTIELFQDLDDGFTLGGRARETHGVSQLILWNINRGLHASMLAHSEFLSEAQRNLCDVDA